MQISRLALPFLFILGSTATLAPRETVSACVDVDVLEDLLEDTLQEDIDKDELAYALTFFPDILSHDDSDRLGSKYAELTGKSIDRYALYGSLREMGCVEDLS